LRRKGIIALAAIATLAIGVSMAFAATPKYPTKVQPNSFDGTENDGLLDGFLETNSKCLGPRLMQVSRKTNSGFKVVDQDYSSAHGAWAFRGRFGPFPATVKVVVARTPIQNRRGEVTGVCKPNAVQFPIDPQPPVRPIH
jgi:hypothetical protein